jgi:hypothetical protein
MSVDDLRIQMRRHIETGDYAAAEALAVEIDRIEGEPVEDDRVPMVIPMWGTDA